MPKYDSIAEEIKWSESHRDHSEQVYQDGFIDGLKHALFLMKSRPTSKLPDTIHGVFHDNYTRPKENS